MFASIEKDGFVESDDFWRVIELQDIDLTITSIAPDSINKVIYVAGYSSGGFHEASSYLMIVTPMN